MLIPLAHLLSDSSDSSDSSVKFVFMAIIAVIWGIAALLNSLKKKGRQMNEGYVQQNWDHLLRDLTGGQSRPFTPSTPAPPLPHLQQQPPQVQIQIRQHMQQTKSFAQQSPRPFVQQYSAQHSPQYPQRPLPPRGPGARPLGAKPYRAPQPIQRKPKPQVRPPAIPQRAVRVPTPPQAQVALIQDSTVHMGQAGGATIIQDATTRTSAPRVTRSQLRKLILWSEILAPPLALREMSPK
jgi:hypothetical protein